MTGKGIYDFLNNYYYNNVDRTVPVSLTILLSRAWAHEINFFTENQGGYL